MVFLQTNVYKWLRHYQEEEETCLHNASRPYCLRSPTSDAQRIKVKAVITGNGSAFKSDKDTNCFRKLCIRHKKTKAYRPQTNGKAERFVQTSLKEWAYARPYHISKERTDMLKSFIRHYNHHRPHWGINIKTPTFCGSIIMLKSNLKIRQKGRRELSR